MGVARGDGMDGEVFVGTGHPDAVGLHCGKVGSPGYEVDFLASSVELGPYVSPDGPGPYYGELHGKGPVRSPGVIG